MNPCDLGILAQEVAHTFWGVLSNILFICRGYGRYCAVLHALPQVYGGVLVGERCLSCIAGGVNCSNYYVWLTNFVQNREGNCATFCGVGAGVTLVCGMDTYEKGLRFPEGLCIHDGGDEGDRTPDLLTASQALSQLSYAPVTWRYYRGRWRGVQGLFWVRF